MAHKKDRNKMPMRRADRMRLVVETSCTDQTILRWLRGDKGVRDATKDRLTKAAKKLKIVVPEMVLA